MSSWSWRKFLGSCRHETSRCAGEVCVVWAETAAVVGTGAGATSCPLRTPAVEIEQQNTSARRNRRKVGRPPGSATPPGYHSSRASITNDELTEACVVNPALLLQTALVSRVFDKDVVAALKVQISHVLGNQRSDDWYSCNVFGTAFRRPSATSYLLA